MREFVAGKNGGAFGAVNFHAFRVAGPHGGGGLNHARGAVAEAEQRVHHVFGLDLVERAQLPHGGELFDRAGEPAKHVDLVNRLVDQRAAAFHGPTAFNGAAVVFGGAKPLHVGVALDEFAQTAGVDGAFEEQGGIVKAVLADHAEHDAGVARGLHHLAGGGEAGGDGLLDLDVFAGFGADAEGLQAEIGEGADVHVVDFGVPAELFVGGDEDAAVLRGEGLAVLFIDVGAGCDAEADVLVRLGVFVGNRSRSDNSYSHGLPLIIMRVHR